MRVLVLAVLVFVVVAVEQAQGQSVSRFTIGSDATLMCTWAAGMKDPSQIEKVKWYKKGRKLKEGKRYMLSNTGLNYTLTIKSVKRSDEGTYICSPKTDVPGTPDGSIRLEVASYQLPKPPAPSNITLYVSSEGQIRCNYGFSKQKYGLKFYWSRNGVKLKKDSHKEGYLKINNSVATRFNASLGVNSSDVLLIENAQLGAAGNYTCNYQYPDGQVFSMMFQINVMKPKGPNDLVRNITWGGNIVTGYLQCDLSSLKNVTINRFYWEKNGVELLDMADDDSDSKSDDSESKSDDSESKYQMKEDGYKHSLTVNDLNTEDSGAYRCVAELEYYPIAVRFNVVVEESRKHLDFSQWSPYSVCDQNGRKFRFRVCTKETCLETYGSVYEVDKQECGAGEEA